MPVIGITLWARDGTPALDLQGAAHALEGELKRVKGTREVNTIGAPGRAVNVKIDPARLRQRGVDLRTLTQALQGANLAMPSGSVIDTTGPRPGLLSVETGEFLRSAEDVSQLVVGVHEGKPVYLREVADVEDGAQQAQRYVWFTPGAASVARTASVWASITATLFSPRLHTHTSAPSALTARPSAPVARPARRASPRHRTTDASLALGCMVCRS